MAIDECLVADDGTIEYRRSGDRVKLSYAFSRKFAGDSCQLTIKRNGKVFKTSLVLSSESPRLNIIGHIEQPQYFVWGGLVFLQCSMWYIEEEFPTDKEDGSSIDLDTMPLALQQAWFRQEKKTSDQEVVILSQVLADDLTVGYSHYKNRVVEKINNEPIRNMRQLADILTKADPKSTPFVRVDLDQHAAIILETDRAIKANQPILQRNRIHPPAHIAPPPK